jgi:hypothetical protein
VTAAAAEVVVGVVCNSRDGGNHLAIANYKNSQMVWLFLDACFHINITGYSLFPNYRPKSLSE